MDWGDKSKNPLPISKTFPELLWPFWSPGTTITWSIQCKNPTPMEDPQCHKPRYWSVTDWYKATLLQGKQVQDTSLWFPYQLRRRRTTGNSHSYSLVQVPECGNEFNQAWESCTTNRWSGDQITHAKWYNFQEELISTLKNHMQAIVILLMQSGMTFVWINQPSWCHYDTIWKWCHPVLYSHWLVIVDYAKQVHTCKRYIYWSNIVTIQRIVAWPNLGCSRIELLV